jgi:hypothetical protein
MITKPLKNALSTFSKGPDLAISGHTQLPLVVR